MTTNPCFRPKTINPQRNQVQKKFETAIAPSPDCGMYSIFTGSALTGGFSGTAFPYWMDVIGKNPFWLNGRNYRGESMQW